MTRTHNSDSCKAILGGCVSQGSRMEVLDAAGFQRLRTRRRSLTRTCLVLIDTVALLLALITATFVRFSGLSEAVGFTDSTAQLSFMELGLLMIPIWLAFLWSEGLYDPDRVSLGSGELSRVGRALALGVIAVIGATYVLKLAGLSRAWTVLFWVFSTLFVLLGRAAFRAIMYYHRRKGRMARPTLVVGSNSEAADIIRILKSSGAEGLVPIGCLASSQAERLSLDWCSDEVPCLGSARELNDVLATHAVDSVVIASSAFDHDVLARMIAELRGIDVDIHVSSGLFEVLTSRVLVKEVGGVPLITVKSISFSRGKILTKRVFDLIVSTVFVVVGLPFWLLIMALIKLTSRGPIFYQQERVGRDGKHFGMYKFRSMVMNADEHIKELKRVNEASGPLFKMRDDPRITPLGKWMRKFSIDEFPQLINVVKGEMSLVGPRPPLPREVENYSQHDWRRLEVVPGMTGLWQVSGRSGLTFDEMVRLDLFYIENWSVGLDLSLIARTVPAVLFARGAY